MNKFGTAQFDLLLSSLCVVVLLFVIALSHVAKFKEADGIERKAEFIIQAEWDAESNDDVDLYLGDPHGKIVNFNRREDGLMHLDRDDRGKLNDQVKDGEDEITFRENIENISIRAILSGEYTCNVHLYNKDHDRPEIEVSVKVLKINPSLKTVASKKVTLVSEGEEITVFRFSVTPEGDVVDIHALPKRFTGDHGPNNYGESE